MVRTNFFDIKSAYWDVLPHFAQVRITEYTNYYLLKAKNDASKQ
jgi:hypothetical protein